MKDRRDFLKSSATLGVSGMLGSPFAKSEAQARPSTTGATNPRGYWLEVLRKLATPVLESLTRRELKKKDAG